MSINKEKTYRFSRDRFEHMVFSSDSDRRYQEVLAAIYNGYELCDDDIDLLNDDDELKMMLYDDYAIEHSFWKSLID
jgi:hypothetical protein